MLCALYRQSKVGATEKMLLQGVFEASKDSHFRTEFGSSFHSFGAALKKLLLP